MALAMTYRLCILVGVREARPKNGDVWAVVPFAGHANGAQYANPLADFELTQRFDGIRAFIGNGNLGMRRPAAILHLPVNFVAK